jgi:hypothetical protein
MNGRAGLKTCRRFTSATESWRLAPKRCCGGRHSASSLWTQGEAVTSDGGPRTEPWPKKTGWRGLIAKGEHVTAPPLPRLFDAST